MTILPLLAFLSFFLILSGKSKREKFLKAALLWALIVNCVTEGLSLFNQFNFLGVTISWVIILAACVPFLRKISLPRISFPQSLPWIWIFTLGTILSVTGLICLFSPPNNWDSMTYHMARVENWILFSSVKAFPTNVSRQVWLNPWAEYAISHFQILLHNSDRMANLIQWFSLVGSMIGVSLITQSFGGEKRAQALSALVVAVTPMVILQGSSTQNDLVCSFFIVGAVYFCLQSIGKYSVRDFVFLSIAVALAIGTKGTAFIYLPAFLVWVGYEFIKLREFKKMVWLTLIGLCFVFIVNSLHWIQNYNIWKNPLGEPAILSAMSNHEHGPTAIISNIIRNISLHCLIPSQSYKNFLVHSLEWFHNLILHRDISSPSTTLFTEKFNLSFPIANEDYAGNPVELFLFVLASFYIAVYSKRYKWAGLLTFTSCIGFGFFLFCFLLKWQPWNSRLHTTLFILAAVPISMALVQKLEKKWQFAVLLLFISSLPWLFFGDARPFISVQNKGLVSVFRAPRINQYFANRPDIRGPYIEVIDRLEGLNRGVPCQNVGLKIGGEAWEYPLWMLAQDRGLNVKFFQIDFPVELNQVSGHSPELCAYIVAGESESWSPQEQSLKKMTLKWASKPIRLYSRE